jgi:hypothetical protein
MKQFA